MVKETDDKTNIRIIANVSVYVKIELAKNSWGSLMFVSL